jgi:hypothetical protein
MVQKYRKTEIPYIKHQRLHGVGAKCFLIDVLPVRIEINNNIEKTWGLSFMLVPGATQIEG